MSTQTVLLADDDAKIRELLELYLTKEGFAVVHASDGAEAILKAQQLKPDLIVLDIMMPVMDGRTALKRIRAIENERGIDLRNRSKILMLSALDDKDNVIGSFEDQCDGYLVKPFNRTEIQECLVRFRWLI